MGIEKLWRKSVPSAEQQEIQRRITEENAPFKLDDKNNPVLLTPEEIEVADNERNRMIADEERANNDFFEKYKNMIGKNVQVEFTSRMTPTDPLSDDYTLGEAIAAIVTAKRKIEAELLGISKGIATLNVKFDSTTSKEMKIGKSLIKEMTLE